jgi:hypothetical protein
VHVTLRTHGIPADWLEPQTVAVGRADRERSLQLVLVVRHWDARLLVHSLALQGEVVRAVERRDPLAREWLARVAWRFDLRHPHNGLLPGIRYWRGAAPAPSPALPARDQLLQAGEESRWEALRRRTDFVPTMPMALEG